MELGWYGYDWILCFSVNTTLSTELVVQFGDSLVPGSADYCITIAVSFEMKNSKRGIYREPGGVPVRSCFGGLVESESLSLD